MLEGYFNLRQCFMANDRKQAIITSFLFFRFPSFSQARGSSKSYLSVKHPIFRVRLELMLGPFFGCRTLTSGDMPSDLHSKFTFDLPPVNLLATNSRNGAKINIADSRKLFAITRCERSRVCPGTVYSHCTLSSR